MSNYSTLQLGLNDFLIVSDADHALRLVTEYTISKRVGAAWWWFDNKPRYAVFFNEEVGVLYDENGCRYSKGNIPSGSFKMENEEVAEFDFSCAIDKTMAIRFFCLLPMNSMIDGLTWD